MATQANIPAAPVKLRPGVFSSYGNGWKQLWPHFLPLFLIGLIYFVISLVINVPQWVTQMNGSTALVSIGAILSFIGFVYGIFIMTPLGMGMSYAYLKASRDQDVEIQDMFAVFKNYWNAVGAGILTTLIVIGGLILLIVPGIIFACKLGFVSYLITDKKMSAKEAVKASWRMTNGHAGQIFLIALMGIPVAIAGLICLGVGVIISAMWISAASASLYHAVSMEKEIAAPPAPGTILPA